LMLGLWQDLRFGVRMLAKNPGFTAIAVLTLALGIGTNTAIFSILDPLLLRALPVRNPGELVQVNAAGTLGPLELSEVQSFYRYRDKNSVFSGVLAFSPVGDCEVTRNGQASSAREESVSGTYFSVLGVQAFVGRLLTPEDDQIPFGSTRVVLSYDYWRRAFSSDMKIVGQTIVLNGSPSTIAGIAPPGFFGVEVGNSPDFYLPLGDNTPIDDYRRAQWVTILARLKPGVPLAQAQAGLEPLFEQNVRESLLPEIEKHEMMARLVLTPAGRGISDLRARFSLPAQILMGVVGLILLIACANVANLLLARSMARRREITVRLALGAGRWRLVRQLLTENALLAALGTLAGVIAGNWASGFLIASLSTKRLPVSLDAGLNGRVMFFAIGVSVLTVFLFGLAPALSATRADLAHDLKVQNGGTGRSSARWQLGKLLVVAQVAFSVMVLVGAGLLLHSLVNLETFNAGFDRDHVLMISMSGHAAGSSPAQLADFYDQLLDRASALPGVRSASYSAFSPISGTEVGINVTVEGFTLQPGETANDLFAGVSPGYFDTMGIPLLAGREFTREDVQTKAPVVIVNRTMARRYFGDKNPLGKHIQFVEGKHPPMEIVGVVADSKYNDLRENASDFFYIPGGTGRVLDVRAAGNPKLLSAPLRELIHSLDSSIAITNVQTLRQQADESLHQDYLVTTLCSIFSVLALVLTCIGLYGTLAFGVARRTNEIGVRMALGATPRDIFSLIVGQGLKLTIAGLLLGVAGAMVAASILASPLFGVKQADPLTLTGVCFIFTCASILACAVPARRAMRVDPMIALRQE
jgi:predicted permease